MPTKRKTPMQTEPMMPAQTVHSEMRGGGHLYMQTNEVPHGGDSANPQRAARILAIIIAPVEKK
jgi:hypothetical protein